MDSIATTIAPDNTPFVGWRGNSPPAVLQTPPERAEPPKAAPQADEGEVWYAAINAAVIEDDIEPLANLLMFSRNGVPSYVTNLLGLWMTEEMHKGIGRGLVFKRFAKRGPPRKLSREAELTLYLQLKDEIRAAGAGSKDAIVAAFAERGPLGRSALYEILDRYSAMNDETLRFVLSGNSAGN